MSGRPEGYPEKDITYICAFAAGSSHDVYFRLLAEKVRQMDDSQFSDFFANMGKKKGAKAEEPEE